MPDHDKKLACLRIALSRQLGAAAADRRLHSPELHTAAFANQARSSSTLTLSAPRSPTNATVIAIKLPEGVRPRIINPLGVADNKAPSCGH